MNKIPAIIILAFVVLITGCQTTHQPIRETVSIPAGTFVMGTKYKLLTEEITEAAQPRHKVSLDGFFIDKYEVTQGDYKKLMGINPTATAYNLKQIELQKKNERESKLPLAMVGDKYPVVNASWYDAVRYCNARSKKEGLGQCYNEETWECDFSQNGYRLPTEAEWEYACRAGADTKYYFGNDKKELSEYANYWPDKNAYFDAVFEASDRGEDNIVWDNPIPSLLLIGSKKPNQWDLYDMLGNAYEWCNDWYDKDYYKNSPQKNPHGPKEGKYKVARGGAYNQSNASCAWRSVVSPNTGIGFRCVKKAR